ncbi:MAG: response regulator [Bacteroidota bacterium]
MHSSNDLKIFIVDDEVIYLNILEQYIRNTGYDNITKFENGTDCLNSITDLPDVVFLDYYMDTLSGLDILRKIRQLNPNIFVVMISGQKDVKLAVDTMKKGAFDYIIKEDNVETKVKDIFQRILKMKKTKGKSKLKSLRKIFQFL